MEKELQPVQHRYFSEDVDLDKVVNVAQVKHRSPFRYPGGKTWLVPRVRQWLLSKERVVEFVEPFCGGAIVGLSVAFDRLAEHITLVELDPQVAAVWQIVIQGSRSDVLQLVERISSFEMIRGNVEETLANTPSDTLERAFHTILKNRVNHGGCLAQGAGLLRNGEKGKGIGSRWYPSTIARRILDIQHVRHSISFFCEDGVEFLKKQSEKENAVFFIDPPYWLAGARLYDFSELDHEHLFEVVQLACDDFLMTYDNVEEIRKYAQSQGFTTRSISMQNKNHNTQKELLISRKLEWLEQT